MNIGKLWCPEHRSAQREVDKDWQFFFIMKNEDYTEKKKRGHLLFSSSFSRKAYCCYEISLKKNLGTLGKTSYRVFKGFNGTRFQLKTYNYYFVFF